MNDGCVTLDEVFAAAGMRAASLVPEISGYLTLAVGDATSRLPFAVDPRLVLITTEGNVGITRRGELLPARRAAADLRAILARLLAVTTGSSMPSLTAAARPREESDRGVDAVVGEIEAALIPVNRAAARRALARLARETIKAKEAGRLRRPSARPAAPAPMVAAPPPAPAPAAPAPIVAAPLPTPAPAEIAPIVAAPPPAPESPAPPVELAPASSEDEQLVQATTPPPEEPCDPTPTVLGMAAMEGYTLLDAHAVKLDDEPAGDPGGELPEEPVLDPDPTALPESTVLGQPTEDPALAFAIAPPLRSLPATQAAVPEPGERGSEEDVACAPREVRPTRADDLLARFGASCTDDESLLKAASSLRRIAGIDLTPPPPTRIELRPASAPLPAAPAVSLPPDWETPVTPRAAPRRGFTGPSLGLTLAVLVVGLAGGGAVVRFRPDLLGALGRPVAPASHTP